MKPVARRFALRAVSGGLALAAGLASPSLASSDLVVLDTFDPSEVGGLCGLGVDPGVAVYVYDCSAASFHAYAPDGTFLADFPRPGESANDVDVAVAPRALDLGAVNVPAGTLLFINGETGPVEVYAIDPGSGAVLSTLVTAFGNSHVVGGAYHPLRSTLFFVQDGVPGVPDGNRIAEVDPVTGAVLNSFQTPAGFTVSFGDLDVSDCTGNLVVVSSSQSAFAELTPDGALVDLHPLPAGVSSLSGIGLDCSAGELWVAGTGGDVWRLGGVIGTLGNRYCSSTPNSSGSAAEIRATGTASVTLADLTVVACPVPNTPGLFFHGSTQVQVPFGNGLRCAGGNVKRGSFAAGVNGQATYTYDGSNGQRNLTLFAGSSRNFQYWFRDPSAGGAQFDTSDGVAVDILP